MSTDSKPPLDEPEPNRQELSTRIRAGALRKKLMSHNSPDTALGQMILQMPDDVLVAAHENDHHRAVEYHTERAREKLAKKS